MIYKETVKDDELRKHLKGKDYFWNITSTVGWGCTNNWQDVMFIQFLLSAAWDLDNLVCDGIFGPKTAASIKGYQKASQIIPLTVDGRISSADGTRLRSTTSNKVYTILMLNGEMTQYLPLTFADPKSNPRLPSALKPYFTSGRRYISPFEVQTLVN